MVRDHAPARVLVVEDVPDIATLLYLLFKAEGYDPIVAADGEEALRLAEARPDLVVLDLLMPPPDGFAVARALRARYQDVPLLGLTVLSGEADHARARACGMNEVVLKPFDPDDLAARVRAWLADPEGRRFRGGGPGGLGALSLA